MLPIDVFYHNVLNQLDLFDFMAMATTSKYYAKFLKRLAPELIYYNAEAGRWMLEGTSITFDKEGQLASRSSTDCVRLWFTYYHNAGDMLTRMYYGRISHNENVKWHEDYVIEQKDLVYDRVITFIFSIELDYDDRHYDSFTVNLLDENLKYIVDQHCLD